MKKQAVIYTRFSPRPNAAECDSCEKQEERCVAYCDRMNYYYPMSYSDRNISGGILSRPGLRGALSSLEPGSVLVVDSPDRLARDMLVSLTIRQQVADAGATIEYANGSPAEDTPEGVLLANILAAFAAYERDRIRLRTKQGLAKKRKNCEYTGGKIKVGWKKDPNDDAKLIVCPHERWAIIKACEWSEDGRSSYYIADHLDKHTLFRGEKWSPRTVRAIITHSCYWAAPSGDPKLEPTHP